MADLNDSKIKIHKGKDAVVFLSGAFYGGTHADGGEVNVVCPNCFFDFTHIHHAGTLIGSDKNEAVEAYDGTFISGTTKSRRSAVEIVFYCENCPELFALVIQQHKGINLVEIHQNVGKNDVMPEGYYDQDSDEE